MSDPWPDLVATALLGVDRRPLPDVTDLVARTVRPGPVDPADDPAVRLLDLAAGHRALHRVGVRPTAGPAVGYGGWPAAAQAPVEAQELLVALVERAEPLMVNCWLECCRSLGLTIGPPAWTPLVQLATRSPQVDRVAVRQVLGESGRWFLTQNPAWKVVAHARPRPAAVASASEVIEAAGADDPAPPVLLEQLVSVPDPWPAELVQLAWRLLAAVRGPASRVAGYRIGCGLPLAAYPMIAPTAERVLMARPWVPRDREAVREAFVLCELAAWSRIVLANSFADVPGAPVYADARHPVLDAAPP